MKQNKLLLQISEPFSRLLAAAKENRQSIKCNMPFRLIGMSIALLGLLGATMTMQAQPPASPLTGTWILEVSFNNASCQPGEVILFNCSYALMTFHEDGTIAEVDTFASGARQSWGAGRWELGNKVDDVQYYNTTFEQLQFRGGGTASHYDTVWGTVATSTDGKRLTANGGFASYTFDNVPITGAGYSGAWTAVGSRMVLLNDSSSTHSEPLPGELP